MSPGHMHCFVNYYFAYNNLFFDMFPRKDCLYNYHELYRVPGNNKQLSCIHKSKLTLFNNRHRLVRDNPYILLFL